MFRGYQFIFEISQFNTFGNLFFQRYCSSGLLGKPCTIIFLLLSACIHTNCPVFGGTSRFFHSSNELIFMSVPFLFEISPLCPAFFILCIILFYCVPPCPAKFNAVSRFYHGSCWHVYAWFHHNFHDKAFHHKTYNIFEAYLILVFSINFLTKYHTIFRTTLILP